MNINGHLGHHVFSVSIHGLTLQRNNTNVEQTLGQFKQQELSRQEIIKSLKCLDEYE